MCGQKMTSKIRATLMLAPAIVLLFFALDYGSTGASAHGSSKPNTQGLNTQEILEAEQRLWDMGYWAGPVDGKFDSDSRHALIAFQKVERRARTGKLTWDELNALRAPTRPLPRHARYPHVEIDLERQVLFLVDETGAVARILPVSTGNGGLYMDHGQIHRAPPSRIISKSINNSEEFSPQSFVGQALSYTPHTKLPWYFKPL